MNRVFLKGRLTKDPEVRWTAAANSADGKSTCIARYNLAVDRRGKDAGADFIPCTAFGKSGEFAEKYLKKGGEIIVSGHIQTGSYQNKSGQTVYTWDVVVEDHEFCGKKDAPQNAPQSPQTNSRTEAYRNSSEGFGSAQGGTDARSGAGFVEVDDEGLPWS